MKEEVGHRAFSEIEGAWVEFTSDQTWEGVRALKDVLQKAMIGKEPEPHAQADGEIVKQARRFSEVAFSHCGPGPKHTATEALAQAIEAEIEALDDRIENVEDALPFHAVSIGKRQAEIEAVRGNLTVAIDRIKDLERKVEDLEKRLEYKKVVELFRAEGDGDGEIVKLTKTLLEVMDRGKNHYQEVMAVAQAIEAKIEAVRKAVEDLREIHKLDTQAQEMDTEDLQRKVEALDYDIERHEGDVVAAHKRCEEMERKVESLRLNQGELIKESIDRHFTVKPQLASPEQGRRVVRCKDEKGVEHDLIPGRSVYWTGIGTFEKIFHHADRGSGYGYACLEDFPGISAKPWWDSLSDIIWLRNLDFPSTCGDRGTIDKAQAELMAVCKRCLSIFQELADQGRYPEMLIGVGWGWLTAAIAKYEGGTQ